MTGPATSWRDRIKVHPAADLFPTMSAAELAELGKDIDDNGLRHPIVLFAERGKWHRRTLVPVGDLKVLDGCNRLDAMERAGIELFADNGDLFPDVSVEGYREPVEILYGQIPDRTEAFDPFAYVISANAHRRHLNREQKRELVEGLLKARPERSDRETAKLAKVDHKTVAAVRTEAEGRGEIPHAATRIDASGRQQPATKPTHRTDGKPLNKEAWRRTMREQAAASAERTAGTASSPNRFRVSDELLQVAKMLQGDRGRIDQIPLSKRVALARGCLSALNVSLDDLRPIEGAL